MTKNNVLTQKDFDALLMWFSPDREEAGVKYEEIRNGLIRFFLLKGCSEAETLADETINRVAKKINTFDTTNNHKHITYFLGFAVNISRESRKKNKISDVEIENLNIKVEQNEVLFEFEENRYKCLEKCLSKLAAEERKLIIEYFKKEKSEKFTHRRNLAEENGLTMGAMQVKVHRIKRVLKNCLENCVEES